MGLETRNAETDRCKVAIIGAGNMAREHVRAFADIPGVTVAGIHSRTRSRAELLAREYGIPLICNSVAELHEQTRADLVVVTVFELAMNAVARACFDFPWTVLLEKPPGYDLADAESIYETARQRKSKVFVALNRRFYASTRAAARRVAELDGERFIAVQDQQDQAAAIQSGQPEIVARNWMYANSIHVIDYLRMFGRGQIDAVEPVVPWDPDRPGVVVSKISFASGDIGLYEGFWNGPGPWAVTVSTSNERWELRPLERAAFQRRGERQLHPVDNHEWDARFKPGFRLQADFAVAAALGKPSESVSLDDAIDTMRLIRSIFAVP